MSEETISGDVGVEEAPLGERQASDPVEDDLDAIEDQEILASATKETPRVYPTPSDSREMSGREIRGLLWSKVEPPLSMEVPKGSDIQITLTRKDGLWEVTFVRGQEELSPREIYGPALQTLRTGFMQFNRLRRQMTASGCWKPYEPNRKASE